MTQQPIPQATGKRNLIWLLVLAVVLMGLSVARQQALGAWHLHADMGLRGSPTSLATSHSTTTISAAASGLASHWLSRWRQQQVFGHGQMRAGLVASPTLWAASAQRHDGYDTGLDPAPGHHHAALERHHHALGDQSVLALDGAAEAADAGSVGAPLLLPQFASPSQGQPLAGMADSLDRNGPWPVQEAVRFASRKVAPLLRPPAVSRAA